MSKDSTSNGISNMNEIDKLLEESKDSNSKNNLTLDNVKGWISEYVEMHADEVARFPDQENVNHWDLIAADYDATRDAHFLAAYFSGSLVTFLAGRGPVPDVQSFAQDSFPENPDEVLAALENKFKTGKRWSAKANDIVSWTNAS